MTRKTGLICGEDVIGLFIEFSTWYDPRELGFEWMSSARPVEPRVTGATFFVGFPESPDAAVRFSTCPSMYFT
jgi:hypothetical protein